ncbi:MAG TPA: NADH-quinone oxidoreductase subunit J [Spirochaetia bacterium]|nr:NADH-quinone oxidoreductase subunit J [Spirochaetia bacterium]
MQVLFGIAGVIAIVATLLAVTRLNAVHALLYLIVSILSLAVIFYVLGAPFASALEVIVYAGAIVVLMLFVVMMLNLGHQAVEKERTLMQPKVWIGPFILAALLLVELIFLLFGKGSSSKVTVQEPAQVGIALFQPYLIGVEIASFLLLAGVVGAFHLGRKVIFPEEKK